MNTSRSDGGHGASNKDGKGAGVGRDPAATEFDPTVPQCAEASLIAGRFNSGSQIALRVEAVRRVFPEPLQTSRIFRCKVPVVLYARTASDRLEQFAASLVEYGNGFTLSGAAGVRRALGLAVKDSVSLWVEPSGKTIIARVAGQPAVAADGGGGGVTDKAAETEDLRSEDSGGGSGDGDNDDEEDGDESEGDGGGSSGSDEETEGEHAPSRVEAMAPAASNRQLTVTWSFKNMYGMAAIKYAFPSLLCAAQSTRRRQPAKLHAKTTAGDLKAYDAVLSPYGKGKNTVRLMGLGALTRDLKLQNGSQLGVSVFQGDSRTGAGTSNEGSAGCSTGADAEEGRIVVLELLPGLKPKRRRRAATAQSSPAAGATPGEAIRMEGFQAASGAETGQETGRKGMIGGGKGQAGQAAGPGCSASPCTSEDDKPLAQRLAVLRAAAGGIGGSDPGGRAGGKPHSPPHCPEGEAGRPVKRKHSASAAEAEASPPAAKRATMEPAGKDSGGGDGLRTQAPALQAPPCPPLPDASAVALSKGVVSGSDSGDCRLNGRGSANGPVMKSVGNYALVQGVKRESGAEAAGTGPIRSSPLCGGGPMTDTKLVWPVASVTHLHGCVLPPQRPPPPREGELRICGLTFGPDLAPVVRRCMEEWQQRLRCSLARADPVMVQIRIPGVDGDVVGGRGGGGSVGGGADTQQPPPPWTTLMQQHGLSRNIVCNRLARLIGLAGDTGSADRELPEGDPGWLEVLERCADPARGGAGLRVMAGGNIRKNAVLGLVGGYVMGRQAFEEFVSDGVRHCSEETRARLAAAVRESSVDTLTAWQLLVRSFSMPYICTAGPEDGGAAGTDSALMHAEVSMLGYGNLAALINDPRVNPRDWLDGNDVDAPEAVVQKANCAVLPISVRGLVLPVVVALRDIAPGEQLLRDYGPGWWRDLAAAWEMAEDDGLELQTLLDRPQTDTRPEVAAEPLEPEIAVEVAAEPQTTAPPPAVDPRHARETAADPVPATVPTSAPAPAASSAAISDLAAPACPSSTGRDQQWDTGPRMTMPAAAAAHTSAPGAPQDERLGALYQSPGAGRSSQQQQPHPSGPVAVPAVREKRSGTLDIHSARCASPRQRHHDNGLGSPSRGASPTRQGVVDQRSMGRSRSPTAQWSPGRGGGGGGGRFSDGCPAARRSASGRSDGCGEEGDEWAGDRDWVREYDELEMWAYEAHLQRYTQQYRHLVLDRHYADHLRGRGADRCMRHHCRGAPNCPGLVHEEMEHDSRGVVVRRQITHRRHTCTPAVARGQEAGRPARGAAVPSALLNGTDRDERKEKDVKDGGRKDKERVGRDGDRTAAAWETDCYGPVGRSGSGSGHRGRDDDRTERSGRPRGRSHSRSRSLDQDRDTDRGRDSPRSRHRRRSCGRGNRHRASDKDRHRASHKDRHQDGDKDQHRDRDGDREGSLQRRRVEAEGPSAAGPSAQPEAGGVPLVAGLRGGRREVHATSPPLPPPPPLPQPPSCTAGAGDSRCLKGSLAARGTVGQQPSGTADISAAAPTAAAPAASALAAASVGPAAVPVRPLPCDDDAVRLPTHLQDRRPVLQSGRGLDLTRAAAQGGAMKAVEPVRPTPVEPVPASAAGGARPPRWDVVVGPEAREGGEQRTPQPPTPQEAEGRPDAKGRGTSEQEVRARKAARREEDGAAPPLKADRLPAPESGPTASQPPEASTAELRTAQPASPEQHPPQRRGHAPLTIIFDLPKAAPANPTTPKPRLLAGAKLAMRSPAVKQLAKVSCNPEEDALETSSAQSRQGKAAAEGSKKAADGGGGGAATTAAAALPPAARVPFSGTQVELPLPTKRLLAGGVVAVSHDRQAPGAAKGVLSGLVDALGEGLGLTEAVRMQLTNRLDYLGTAAVVAAQQLMERQQMSCVKGAVLRVKCAPVAGLKLRLSHPTAVKHPPTWLDVRATAQFGELLDNLASANEAARRALTSWLYSLTTFAPSVQLELDPASGSGGGQMAAAGAGAAPTVCVPLHSDADEMYLRKDICTRPIYSTSQTGDPQLKPHRAQPRSHPVQAVAAATPGAAPAVKAAAPSGGAAVTGAAATASAATAWGAGAAATAATTTTAASAAATAWHGHYPHHYGQHYQQPYGHYPYHHHLPPPAPPQQHSYLSQSAAYPFIPWQPHARWPTLLQYSVLHPPQQQQFNQYRYYADPAANKAGGASFGDATCTSAFSAEPVVAAAASAPPVAGSSNGAPAGAAEAGAASGAVAIGAPGPDVAIGGPAPDTAEAAAVAGGADVAAVGAVFAATAVAASSGARARAGAAADDVAGGGAGGEAAPNGAAVAGGLSSTGDSGSRSGSASASDNRRAGVAQEQ